ncbi:hypothetical protein JCM10207_003484 [Rhodosporidiobolus poonsookiae]
MPKRASSPAPSLSSSPSKKPRLSRSPSPASTSASQIGLPGEVYGKGQWRDWPAPREQMESAKDFIRECVTDKHRVLLIPDKDADGLSSCVLLSLALSSLGHPSALVEVYHLPRAMNVHAPEAQEEMLRSFSGQGPTRAVVLDQGSRPGAPLLPLDKAKVLIIDHHLSSSFPEGAEVVSACNALPVATTSLLSYLLVAELCPAISSPDTPGGASAGTAALVGVYGDLGSSGPSKPVFSDPSTPWPARLGPLEKRLTKTALAKAVALLNAPRRTPQFNVAAAYAALADAVRDGGPGLKGVMGDVRLLEAKERTSAETARWQGAPPVFSKDGRVAVVKIDSGYQIHPVIATRWCGTLRKAKTLVCVMCANTGYTPGMVHFSCRAPRRSLDDSKADPVDLIAFLRSLSPLCDALSPSWSSRVGSDFARGHREATGGIIGAEEFEVLVRAIELGVKKEKGEGGGGGGGNKKGKGVIDPGQKNTLDGFFKVKGKGKEGKEETKAVEVS